MKYLSTLIFCISFILHFEVEAQVTKSKLGVHTKSKKAFELYKSAENAYARDEIEMSLDYLDQAIAKDDCFIEAYLLKADIYFRLQNPEYEIVNIQKALDVDSMCFVSAYFNMGVAMFNTSQYDEVEGWMQRYKDKVKGTPSINKADKLIEKAEFAAQAVKHPVAINPQKLGSEVNSIYDEYWPSISADEEDLVFTVLVPRDPVAYENKTLVKNALNFKEDFFISEKRQGEWNERQPIISINTDGNEGAQSISADGKWMFITACGRADGKGSCDLYFSQRTQKGWTTPVNLGSPINTPYWESQPSFSSDGKTLYFVSNRAGGVGQKDIWKATIFGINKDGTPYFGDVQNLGESINTTGDENSPFIHQDNETLYFSSEGWPGMGQMDLFFSKLNDAGQWQEPVNLGYPINTSNDEIGLVLNASGDRAYYSSEGMIDNYESKDLFTFVMPQSIRPIPSAYIKGRVFDKETKKQLSALLEINDLEKGQIVVTAQSTDYSGEYLFCLPVGKDYGLNVEKAGYLFYSGYFDVKDNSTVDEPQVLDVYLSRIKKGERMILRNVFFQTDSYELKPESYSELNKVADLLVNNKDVRVEIGGHTDNVGTSTYNKNLAEKRAKAVYDYIVDKGIEATRLVYKGYGYEQPMDTNETETGRANNRRTEVKVL